MSGYVEFTLIMAHCTFSNDEELEILRKDIEDLIKDKYPVDFESDVELEIDFHSGPCTNKDGHYGECPKDIIADKK